MEEVIRLNSYMGDCILSVQYFSVRDKGLSIETAPCTSYIYYKKETDNVLQELPASKIVAEPKRFFEIRKEYDVAVFQVNKQVFNSKGYISKMHFDKNYNYASIDINLPYDIFFHVDETKVVDFINYAFVRFPQSYIDYNDIFKDIALFVNNVFKRTIGESHIYAVETLETEADDLAQYVINNLNGLKEITSKGLVIDSFRFTVTDDYSHREEKKRVQHNKRLYK